jgi:hypothetical protein
MVYGIHRLKRSTAVNSTLDKRKSHEITILTAYLPGSLEPLKPNPHFFKTITKPTAR